MTVVLAGTEDHPQARMVLGSALASGQPSHAYLFHGPAGTGKRTVARAFAAELLAEGVDDPDAVRTRVMHGAHPDLTWVRPSGAHVMRVDDVEGPVVSAATRTPFEARRRVFVLERVDTMNDEVANRLLKTLEEPAAYVHLILMTDAAGRAEACARLALGNASRARYLASPEGEELRSEVEQLVVTALSGGTDAGMEPWRPLLARAEVQGVAAEEAVGAEARRRLELEPKGRERRAI